MKRFWDKVNKTATCWEWMGAIRSGYGCLKIDGKTVDAHRYSYHIHFGHIPASMCICHKCDNRKCVRPDHLFLGTYADNHKDMCQKGRDAYSKTIVTIICPTCHTVFKRQSHRLKDGINDKHIAVTCSISCGNKLDWKIKKGTASDIKTIRKEAIIKTEELRR